MSERGNGFTLMSAGASLWEGEQLLMSALPLTYLPASSPRIVTGRGTLSSTVLPIINSAEVAPGPQPVPSPRHYAGRRCRQADEKPRERPEMVRGCTEPDVIVPA